MPVLMEYSDKCLKIYKIKGFTYMKSAAKKGITN